MQVLLKTKIGPVLVISAVLAVWALLAAQHVQAHSRTTSLPSPSCGNLPSEAGFLSAISITSSALAPQGQSTKRGGGRHRAGVTTSFAMPELRSLRWPPENSGCLMRQQPVPRTRCCVGAAVRLRDPSRPTVRIMPPMLRPPEPTTTIPLLPLTRPPKPVPPEPPPPPQPANPY